MVKDTAPEMNVSGSEAEEEREEPTKVDGERDPDFSQVRGLYEAKDPAMRRSRFPLT